MRITRAGRRGVLYKEPSRDLYDRLCRAIRKFRASANSSGEDRAMGMHGAKRKRERAKRNAGRSAKRVGIRKKTGKRGAHNAISRESNGSRL